MINNSNRLIKNSAGPINGTFPAIKTCNKISHGTHKRSKTYQKILLYDFTRKHTLNSVKRVKECSTCVFRSKSRKICFVMSTCLSRIKAAGHRASSQSTGCRVPLANGPAFSCLKTKLARSFLTGCFSKKNKSVKHENFLKSALKLPIKT